MRRGRDFNISDGESEGSEDFPDGEVVSDGLDNLIRDRRMSALASRSKCTTTVGPPTETPSSRTVGRSTIYLRGTYASHLLIFERCKDERKQPERPNGVVICEDLFKFSSEEGYSARKSKFTAPVDLTPRP